ncbi:glycerophosphoryl diester phosphodiesterase membrane domain-containing protein [Streptococcus hyointestinalis]|uniref:glycerophosphoryl diester phosphodiesterase membrane domain-containing protein n=1 Tax=Streptococcus hyointestinalis TaxID=1337 RepID=UPI003F95C21D
MKAKLSKLSAYFPALRRFLIASLFLYTIYSFIVKGILQFIFNRILIFAGVTGLSKETILTVIKDPIALFFLILFLVLVAFFLIGEFAVLTLAVTDQWHRDSLKILLKKFPQKVKQLLSWQFIIVFFYLCLMIPLGNLGFNSLLLSHLKIPDFIGEELAKTQTGSLLYGGLMVVIAYLNIRLITFLPILGLTDSSPLKAFQISWRESTFKKLLKRTARLIILTTLSFVITIILVIGITIIFANLDSKNDNLPLATLLYSLIAFLYTLFLLSTKFFFIIEATRQLDLPKELQTRTHAKMSTKGRFALVSFILFFGVLWVASNALDIYLVKKNPDEIVIAHRGNVKAGVENSIEAMQAAKKAGAAYSEMDVVMTKDKRFVVIHDNNLKRLAGVDNTVSNMTLKELQKLTLHQGKFTSHIASLEEFLAAAKAVKQPIFIELKPYGHEPKDYVERFLKVLKEQNATKDNKVMSLDLDVIQKVEKLAPEISTGYVIPIHMGPLPNYAVDFYAVEEFSYNTLFALTAEQQKKDVYVWTINDETLMDKMLIGPANGIITDELGIFKEASQDMKADTSYLQRALRLFNSRQ